MTVPLTTRGMICQRSSRAIAINSWGVLCFEIRPFLETDVGFIFGAPEPSCEIIFDKGVPPVYAPSGAGLFSTPGLQLVGRKSPLMGRGALSLAANRTPPLFNKTAAQLTGSKVVRTVGEKELLLTEPEEPTLTSSGTKVPDLLDKC